MGNNACKIDSLGLSDYVQQLVTSGVTSRAKVASRLKSDHPDVCISEATIGRYLSKLKSSAGSKAYQIISDHVDRVVPVDLKALEAMETQAYNWAMESPKVQAARLADMAASISSEIDTWKDLIRHTDDPEKTVKQIIKICMGYFAEDAREQDARLRATAAATKIIQLKLEKAGLLDDDARGRIILMTRPKPDSETPVAGSRQIRLCKPREAE